MPTLTVLNSELELLIDFEHSFSLHHGPNIYKDTKPLMSAFLKKLPIKVLWRHVYIYLFEAPDPPPPLFHYTLFMNRVPYMYPCT
jgi:hypothetical protein